MQQIKVAESNIVRIERSLKDAQARLRYEASLTRSNSKRATITLNNLQASKKSNEDLLLAKLTWLKYSDELSRKV